MSYHRTLPALCPGGAVSLALSLTPETSLGALATEPYLSCFSEPSSFHTSVNQRCCGHERPSSSLKLTHFQAGNGTGNQGSSHGQQIQTLSLHKCCLQWLGCRYLLMLGAPRPWFQTCPGQTSKPLSWACPTPHWGGPDKTASVGSIFLFPDGSVCWLHPGPPMAVWEPGPSARLILRGAGERQPSTVHKTPMVLTTLPGMAVRHLRGPGIQTGQEAKMLPPLQGSP